LADVAVQDRDRFEVIDVIATGAELTWLLARDRKYSTDPGSLFLLRTTPRGGTLGSVDDLTTPATAISSRSESLGALLPGTAMPTMLTPYHHLPPRSNRVAGRRLDGTLCVLSDAGVPDTPDGGATSEERAAERLELEAGGGCACRAARMQPQPDETEVRAAWLTAWTVLLGLGILRARRRYI
jgi:hypothetical protein